MTRVDSVIAKENLSDDVDTIFTNGMFTIESQIAKYKEGRFQVSTGEWVECKGRNHLRPLNVLINPYICSDPKAAETKDVDIDAFKNFYSYLHPFTVISNAFLRFSDVHYHIETSGNTSSPTVNSIKNFALKYSEMNFGQRSDLKAHQRRYKSWKKERPNKKLILYGMSRGAATAFCAACHCKEVKLVIVEGCPYSVEDAIARSPIKLAARLLSSGLSFFTKYKPNGLSPSKYIKNFPRGIPVVFITSEKDTVVPCKSTERLANELNERGENDVYLLKLKKSSHPSYMFDNAEDHKNYECLINAIYKKYGFKYYDDLAAQGEPLLKTCLLKENPKIQLNERVALSA